MTLKAYLLQRCGGDTLPSRSCPSFAIQTPEGEREVVFDPYNRRIKLYGLTAAAFEASDDAHVLVQGEPDLATKLTVYARPGDEEAWSRQGFRHEGIISGYFSDRADAHIWALYSDPDRAQSPKEAEHDRTVALALSKPTVTPTLPEGYTCHAVEPKDVPEIAATMRLVFQEYPTPLEPDYIEDLITTQANHFRLVRDRQGQVAAVASAELDHDRRSAEMTDCATHPEHRGRGLMAYLLWQLERDVPKKYGILDFYTLARADEIGMNIVFSKLGYDYTGRLVNNCQMPNGWESMNIWCKAASEA